MIVDRYPRGIDPETDHLNRSWSVGHMDWLARLYARECPPDVIARRMDRTAGNVRRCIYENSEWLEEQRSKFERL